MSRLDSVTRAIASRTRTTARRPFSGAEPDAPLTAAPSSIASACILVFAVACLLRLALLVSGMAPEAWLLPESTNEIGRVARTLAESGRYADPYLLPTGPTAHPPPVWTGLRALIYHLFGFGLVAGRMRALLGIVCWSAMVGVLPWIAARTGIGRRAGLAAGLAGALVPFQQSEEVIGWTANEPLAALALAVAMVLTLRGWNASSRPTSDAFGLGLLWGLGFHAAPALVTVMAGFLVAELRWGGRRAGRGIAWISLGAALACAPWAWRNARELGGLVFVRSNFGLELRLGHHDGAAADMVTLDAREGKQMRHPGQNADEARRVAELGELEYMRRARQEAVAWMVAHPGETATLAGQRFLHVWLGSLGTGSGPAWLWLVTVLAAVGLWRSWPALAGPARSVLLAPLALFPLVYYLVTYMSRYLVPIGWIVLLLAGAALFPPRPGTDGAVRA